ncbi:MAG TPA: tRNA (N6-threonylcarbamoyladenosine(37)-N6)-methyltransferase TrmO [Bacteroidales bacterium]|nr:tRNA (N6-threonylcarbamoyladenosine(37)-N6)-methyltransferase TrmO [Bacteroidales bacterium]
MQSITFKPIGIIHTPFKEIGDMPIQPVAAEGVRGYIELFPEYAEGLSDLDGFSHIMLLYHFHRNEGYKLKVKPFMDNEERGLFATRAPRRPNGIGLSTVRLISIEGSILHIEQVDMLDETPLLDIKPFFQRFDNRHKTRAGWLEKNKSRKPGGMLSDGRFGG